MPGTMTCKRCGVTASFADVDALIAWDRAHVCAASLPGRLLTREEVGYSIGLDAGQENLVKTALAYVDLAERIPDRLALIDLILGYPAEQAPRDTARRAGEAADRIYAALGLLR